MPHGLLDSPTRRLLPLLLLSVLLLTVTAVAGPRVGFPSAHKGLWISSVPLGAEVYVAPETTVRQAGALSADWYKGKTPLHLPALKPGRSTVCLWLPAASKQVDGEPQFFVPDVEDGFDSVCLGSSPRTKKNGWLKVYTVELTSGEASSGGGISFGLAFVKAYRDKIASGKWVAKLSSFVPRADPPAERLKQYPKGKNFTFSAAARIDAKARLRQAAISLDGTKLFLEMLERGGIAGVYTLGDDRNVVQHVAEVHPDGSLTWYPRQ